MHRTAIAPKPPHRAATLDAHILIGNQAARTMAEIIQVRLFHPPTHGSIFLLEKNQIRTTSKPT